MENISMERRDPIKEGIGGPYTPRMVNGTREYNRSFLEAVIIRYL
ncbi:MULTISPECIES: hypothetical protein [Metallosphaera]|nr:hypothetical protein [Metallosphaera sedula]